MAFELNNFNNVTSGAAKGVRLWSYRSDDDNLATITADGYFNAVANQIGRLDLIYVLAADGSQWNRVISPQGFTPVATEEYSTPVADGSITTLKLADLAVTEAKIDSAAVSLDKLAPGVRPSHIVAFAGQQTTVGGAASEAFAIPGALATDLAFVQMVNNGTNAVDALNAVVTDNTLTVTFSADPTADAVINYQLLRAAF